MGISEKSLTVTGYPVNCEHQESILKSQIIMLQMLIYKLAK